MRQFHKFKFSAVAASAMLLMGGCSDAKPAKPAKTPAASATVAQSHRIRLFQSDFIDQEAMANLKKYNVALNDDAATDYHVVMDSDMLNAWMFYLKIIGEYGAPDGMVGERYGSYATALYNCPALRENYDKPAELAALAQTYEAKIDAHLKQAPRQVTLYLPIYVRQGLPLLFKGPVGGWSKHNQNDRIKGIMARVPVLGCNLPLKLATEQRSRFPGTYLWYDKVFTNTALSNPNPILFYRFGREIDLPKPKAPLIDDKMYFYKVTISMTDKPRTQFADFQSILDTKDPDLYEYYEFQMGLERGQMSSVDLYVEPGTVSLVDDGLRPIETMP